MLATTKLTFMQTSGAEKNIFVIYNPHYMQFPVTKRSQNGWLYDQNDLKLTKLLVITNPPVISTPTESGKSGKYSIQIALPGQAQDTQSHSTRTNLYPQPETVCKQSEQTEACCSFVRKR